MPVHKEFLIFDKPYEIQNSHFDIILPGLLYFSAKDTIFL